MNLSALGYDEPIFSQPELVKITRPTAATIDNWLRYNHIVAAGSDNGRRLFSFANGLRTDCVEMLTAVFKMPPLVSAGFAEKAVDIYRVGFEADRAEIALGRPWPAATRDLDGHFYFVRQGDDVVALDDARERDDGVMLVLPTRIIARRLLSAIAELDRA